MLPVPDGAVTDFASLLATLKEWQTSASGIEFIERTGWLLGFGFDDSQLSEGVFPTANELSTVTENKPFMIIHQSGHFGVFNRRALALAGIDDCTEEIPCGLIRC